MFDIINHKLYKDDEQVEFIESPNCNGILVPTLIVIHYTGANSCQSALDWLCSEESQVSAHLLIDKDGSVYQLVPFNRVAWHAGKSSYNGKPGVNKFSIGIENVGIGDEWPDEQIEILKNVIIALCANYQIENIVGHEDIAPGRKSDPGPNFPWDKVTSEA